MATLKISELSVGDWVRYKGNIGKVKAIDIWDRVLLRCDALMPTVRYYELEPILITAEILEKNGWASDGMYAFLRIDENRHLEYYYHEHRLRKYYCGKDEWQNHAKVTDITFAAHCYSVHQLQHALRLAGVDKEINL